MENVWKRNLCPICIWVEFQGLRLLLGNILERVPRQGGKPLRCNAVVACRLRRDMLRFPNESRNISNASCRASKSMAPRAASGIFGGCVCRADTRMREGDKVGSLAVLSIFVREGIFLSATVGLRQENARYQ